MQEMARRMLGRMYEGEDCAAARALELVGERWSLLILRDALFRHFTRYSQFQSSLAIAPNILAKRLNTLVEAGILRTHALESRGQEYLLTEMGQSLKPVIVSLTRWGDHWIGPGRWTSCTSSAAQRSSTRSTVPPAAMTSTWRMFRPACDRVSRLNMGPMASDLRARYERRLLTHQQFDTRSDCSSADESAATTPGRCPTAWNRSL